MAVERIALIGFSGTGKSTVARALAARLGWSAVDTDAEVESAFGRSIPAIFAAEGEGAFRAAERRSLAAALKRDRVVVAAGGGAAVDPEAWSDDLLVSPGTLVVALDTRPETSVRRLVEQRAAEGGAVERPLLAGDDPVGRGAALKSARQPTYDRADVTLVVDGIAAEAVADEIVGLIGFGREPTIDAPDVELKAPSGRSAIFVRPGSGDRIGVLGGWAAVAGREAGGSAAGRPHRVAPTTEAPAAKRAWIVTDANVGPRHAPAVVTSLEAVGFGVGTREVVAGEGSKSLAVVSDLYDWLLGAGIERGDVVVALGGGMVGDLAGFVAATCLRGVGLVQVPTSLLAMVDSSVGGKTGINHAAGKNLIGAFYQPPLVVIDPLFLRTLPPRELTSGWAEIVKHALIQPSTPGGERADLMTFLERNADQLVRLEEPATSYLIRRNVALKAAVVEADEREAGIRAYLNFGHTLGHAIEAAGYQHLHGEAVALGMRAAARIGQAVGACDAETEDRLDALLDRFGLPARTTADPDRVLALLGSDKKRASGRQRWVLPVTGGGVSIRDDVPDGAVRQALTAIVAAPAAP